MKLFVQIMLFLVLASMTLCGCQALQKTVTQAVNGTTTTTSIPVIDPETARYFDTIDKVLNTQF